MTRTLRALALALGTSDLCGEETRANVRDWTVKTRRLADFALDALAATVSDETDGEHGEQTTATRECATRLLAAIHVAYVNGATSRVDTVDAAAAYHARLCDVTAAVIRARDASCVKTLVRLVVDSIDLPETSERASVAEEVSARARDGFSARAEKNVAARLFGGADAIAMSAIAHPAWFSRLLLDGRGDGDDDDAPSRLESFLAALRDATHDTRAETSSTTLGFARSDARDVSRVFDSVAAANNLVWSVSGWHPAAAGSRGGAVASAKTARARLVSLPRSTTRAFLETLDALLREDDVAERDASHGEVPALREAWFVAGVARDGDAASLDALAELYWRACRDASESDERWCRPGDRAASNGEASRARRRARAPTDEDEDATTRRGVVSARRGMLGALAFAPGIVRALWLRCASRIPAAISLSAEEGERDETKGEWNRSRERRRDPGAGGPGLWTSPALALGAASVARHDIPVLGAFALAYAQLLEVLDDDEFFEAQTPFSLNEQRAVAAAANTLVVRERLRKVSSRVARRGTDPSAIAIARDRHAVTAACASLLRALVTRDERRSFAPDGMWLAPARVAAPAPLAGAPRFFPSDEIASPLPPAAAAAALLGAATNDDARGSGLGAPDGSDADRGENGFVAFLTDCPHAIPFETRVETFRNLVAADRARLGVGAQAGGVDADRVTQGQRVTPVKHLRVRRDHLLEDTLAGLGSLGSRAKGRIAVTFVNAAGREEAGIDAGGLFKELLGSALAELVDPLRGLFRETDRLGLYPVARAGDDSESAALLELAGLLMGKALYEGVLHEYRLAPFFAKKMLRKPLSLDDLPSLDAGLHRSLRQVLQYEGDVTDLCLDWYAREDAFGRVVAHALRPGEKAPEDVVESHDALAWAHATAEFHLVRRRRGADMAFERGMFAIIPRAWLRLFGANELGSLMTGDADGDVDVDDLRAHCAFGGGYTERSRTVRMFWECVSSFTRDERRALLRFVTSSSAPPVRGFAHLHPPFTVHKVRCEVGRSGNGVSRGTAFLGAALASLGLAARAPDVERLPTASTCFNVLKLPNFRRLDTMKTKLRTAIRSGAGFELS